MLFNLKKDFLEIRKKRKAISRIVDLFKSNCPTFHCYNFKIELESAP